MTAPGDRFEAAGLFDPETIKILVDAFDSAWAGLLASGAPFADERYHDAARDIVANEIILMARRPAAIRRLVETRARTIKTDPAAQSEGSCKSHEHGGPTNPHSPRFASRSLTLGVDGAKIRLGRAGPMSWWAEQRQAWRRDWGSIPGSTELAFRRAKRTIGRIVGFSTRILVYGALFFLLFWLWSPPNIFDKPIAALTLGEIAHWLLFVGALGVLGGALFNPTHDQWMRQTWTWLGFSLMIGVVVLALYLNALPH